MSGHLKAATGASHLRLQSAAGRKERIAELRAYADYYKSQGKHSEARELLAEAAEI